MATSSRSRVRASDGPAWLELPVFSACVTWSSLTILHHAACVVAAWVDVFTPNDKLLVRFPRCDSEANNYACALMSKRESRRRRWSGRRMPVARRTVKLSRRVHYQNWNRTLAVEWESFLHDHHLPGSEPDEMEFELFHTLPAPIPKELCFAGVMGLRTNDETRHQAMEHSDARRRARAIIDKRRADFNRISRKYKSLIERVNRTVHERGFRAWINVIEMCSAARAFELRWLFRAEESRFGNWRMARYHLLDMDPVVLEEATHRRCGTLRIRQEH